MSIRTRSLQFVMVEDAEMVEMMLEVSDALNLGLHADASQRFDAPTHTVPPSHPTPAEAHGFWGRISTACRNCPAGVQSASAGG